MQQRTDVLLRYMDTIIYVANAVELEVTDIYDQRDTCGNTFLLSIYGIVHFIREY